MKRFSSALGVFVAIMFVISGCDQAESLDSPNAAGTATEASASSNNPAVLSGSVFVDADGDPARAANELGISDVLVEVHDLSGFVASVLTDSEGAFSFSLPPSFGFNPNPYTVRVPETASPGFNATLFSSYDYVPVVPGSSPEIEILLQGDVSDVDFGFDIDQEEVVIQLTEGEFQTAARSLRFWKTTARIAFRNQACDVTSTDPEVICRDELGVLLDIILDDYLLPDPYTVEGGGDKFEWAYNMLRTNARTDYEKVLQKNLAAELNRHALFGSPDLNFDDTFFSYIEEWLNNNNPTSTGRRSSSSEEKLVDAYLAGGGGGPVVD